MLHWQWHVHGTSGSPTTALICGGLTGEPLTLVQAVRSRHNGCKRNDQRMKEVRHHYTRSAGSFALRATVMGGCA
jgi:hypothetical protein